MTHPYDDPIANHPATPATTSRDPQEDPHSDPRHAFGESRPLLEAGDAMEEEDHPPLPPLDLYEEVASGMLEDGATDALAQAITASVQAHDETTPRDEPPAEEHQGEAPAAVSATPPATDAMNPADSAQPPAEDANPPAGIASEVAVAETPEGAANASTGSVTLADLQIPSANPSWETSRKRVRSLLQRWAKEQAVNIHQGPIDWDAFIGWVKIRIAPTVKWSTWNHYRWSINQVTDHAFAARMRNVERPDQRHPDNRPTRNGVARPRGHAKRAKSVSRESVDILHEALIGASASWKWAATAWLWFRATLYTGARPSEWDTSTIESTAEGPVLWLRNAKRGTHTFNNEGKGLEAYRAIPLAHLAPDVQRDIRQLQAVLAAAHARGRYQEVQRGVQQTIQLAVSRLWPEAERRISLYSARHQFINDLRRASVDEATIATLAGHASTETQDAYGAAAAVAQSATVPFIEKE